MICYFDMKVGFRNLIPDLGHCHTLPSKIEVQPGTAPVASRPCWTNPVIASQVDTILDAYLAAGIIELSVGLPFRDGS